MKRSYRMILILLAFVLTCSFAACSSETEKKEDGNSDIIQKENPEPADYVGMITFSTYRTDENDMSAFNFIQAYNMKYPGVEIKLDNSLSREEYFATLDARIQSGDIGDVFMIDDSRMAKYADTGLIANLSPYLEELIDYDTYKKLSPSELLLPAAYEASLYEGRMYMCATEYNNRFVFLNLSVIAEAGLSVPADLWTWTDLMEYAQQISGFCDYPLSVPYDDYAVWGAFARSFGTSVYQTLDVELNSKSLNLTDPAVVNGLMELADLIYTYGNVKTSEEISAEELSSYGMIVASYADLIRWEAALKSGDFEWDLAHFPQWERTAADGTSVYYRSIGAEALGLAVHSKTGAIAAAPGDDNYKEEAELAQEKVDMSAHLALFALVESAAVDFAGSGHRVPAMKAVNSMKFWREYPVSGKNSAVFSYYSGSDFAGVLTSFLPVQAAEELDIGTLMDSYAAFRKAQQETDAMQNRLFINEALQLLQDATNANW